MIKIYNYKTGKLREVILEPGEKAHLCSLNLKSINPTLHRERAIASAITYKAKHEQKEKQKGI